MKKVIVLDFNSWEVHVYNYRTTKGKGITQYYTDVKDYLREHTEHQLSNCQWMVLDEKAVINIH